MERVEIQILANLGVLIRISEYQPLLFSRFLPKKAVHKVFISHL